MSSIVLGTAQFGLSYGVTNNRGKIDFSEVCYILEEAFNSESVSKLDTSFQYGDAETVINQATKEIGRSFDIITKTRNFNNFQKRKACNLLVRDFEYSIERLSHNKVTTLLFHSESDLLLEKSDDLYAEALILKKKHEGLKIGVSVYEVENLRKIMAKYPIEVVQFPFNFFDRRFMEIYDDLNTRNIDIYARSIFLQGILLADEISFLPKHFHMYKKYFYAYYEKVKQFNLNKQEFNLALAKLSFENIILGVSSIRDFKSNLESFQNAIPEIFSQNDSTQVKSTSHIPMKLIDPREWKL